MSSVGLFLNTRIEDSGILQRVGNLGLTPVRYLSKGRDVRIEIDRHNDVTSIHHVKSYHRNGYRHSSRTAAGFTSSSKSHLKTVAAIVLLIPGLLLSVCKLLSYVFAASRRDHALVKEHFTPINRTIGSEDAQVGRTPALSNALDREWHKPLNQKTHAIVVYGDQDFNFDADPGMLRFNPQKIVLIGARAVNSHRHTLTDEMGSSRKWITKDYYAHPEQAPVTLDEILNAPQPQRQSNSGKLSHVFYQMQALAAF